jgi:hypothetical protein
MKATTPFEELWADKGDRAARPSRMRYTGIATAYKGKVVEVVRRNVRVDGLDAPLVAIRVAGFDDLFLVGDDELRPAVLRADGD